MTAITEVFVADGAADEQMASELLRPRALGVMHAPVHNGVRGWQLIVSIRSILHELDSDH